MPATIAATAPRPIHFQLLDLKTPYATHDGSDDHHDRRGRDRADRRRLALPRPREPTGRSGLVTNAPVNHVAMVVALRRPAAAAVAHRAGPSIESVWTGEHHRGAQLNRLDEALQVWTGKYGQRAFVRQFDGEITREMEDELLRVIAEYDGRPFPNTSHLVGKWLVGPAAAGRPPAGGVLRRAARHHLHADGPARPRSARRTGTTRAGSGAATASSSLGGASLGPEIAVTIDD